MHFAPPSMIWIKVVDSEHPAAERFETVLYGLKQNIFSIYEGAMRIRHDHIAPDQQTIHHIGRLGVVSSVKLLGR
jgi:hypothetical protein